MSEREIFVSIVVPTYNRAHLIGETIQSIIDQTYTHWELIIVDDGSEDDTKNIIDRFTDKRIQYFAIAHCGMFGKVRNMGMQRAKGDLIAFLDSDDLWKPNKLSFQLSLFKQDPDAGFIFGHAEQFGIGAIPPPQVETFYSGNVFIPLLLEERFVFVVPSIMFKKEVLHTVGYIDESLIIGSDVEYFLRMACRYKGIFSNEILVRTRKHDENTSQRLEVASHLEHKQMIEKFFRDGYLSKEQYVFLASTQFYKLGLVHLRKKKPKEAMNNFLSYINLKPLHYKGWIRLGQAALGALS
ncbi:MAG TPA: glycosyltransferase [Chryseolinea sp.]|nr:glycosyltransferase [Chryseolinea sp.]